MKKEDLVEDAPSRDIDSHENNNNDDHNPIYNAVNEYNTNSPHVVNADQGTHEMMLSEAIRMQMGTVLFNLKHSLKFGAYLGRYATCRWGFANKTLR